MKKLLFIFLFLLVCLGGIAQENLATNVDFDSVYFSTTLDTQAVPPSDLLTELQTLINNSDCNCKATVYYSITLSSMGKVDKVKIIWGENICWSLLVMEYLLSSAGWSPGLKNDTPVHSRFLFPVETISPYWEPCE